MLKGRLTRNGFALAACVLAASCAAPRGDAVPVASIESASMLSSAASRAADAQETLARIQAARTKPAPKPIDENMAGVPAALRTPVTIAWSGPGEEAARRVAAVIGFDFSVQGSVPATPPLVDVDSRGEPAVRVLQDIGYQVDPLAQVVVDARTRRIEFRFVDGPGAAPQARVSK